MARSGWLLAGTLALSFPVVGLAAPPLEAPPLNGTPVRQVDRQVDRPLTSQQMAARIDELLAKRWRDESIKPAPVASDGEFLRRASLDLSGIIPTVQPAMATVFPTSCFSISARGKRYSERT